MSGIVFECMYCKRGLISDLNFKGKFLKFDMYLRDKTKELSDKCECQKSKEVCKALPKDLKTTCENNYCCKYCNKENCEVRCCDYQDKEDCIFRERRTYEDLHSRQDNRRSMLQREV